MYGAQTGKRIIDDHMVKDVITANFIILEEMGYIPFSKEGDGAARFGRFCKNYSKSVMEQKTMRGTSSSAEWSPN